MTSKDYELSVLINGRPIKEYGHKGLTFVEGRKDQVYSIKFRNNTSMRVLAVVSVDGIGVVDGKPATTSSKGYVVPGYSATEIQGWRSSLSKTHEFVFNPKTGSYSAQTQAEGDINCGVIEVKVFTEDFAAWINKEIAKKKYDLKPPQEHHHHHHHYPPLYVEPIRPWSPWTPMYVSVTPGDSTVTYSCSNTAAGHGLSDPVKLQSFNCCVEPSAMAANVVSSSAPAQDIPDFNLGTAWGAEREDKVDEVEFERGVEQATLTVYYSDAEGLKKSGIEVSKEAAVSKPVLPRGFNGFCVPPKASQ